VYFYDIFKNLIMKTKDILLVGAGATIIYLLWRRSQKAKDLKGIAGGNGTIGGASTGAGAITSGATSSEPEQVYGLNLPAGMGLPNLTAGTGVPTEVAVQQGGIVTTPTPAIATTPVLSIEDALGSGIKPIKDTGITTPVLQPIEYPVSEPRPKPVKSIYISEPVIPNTSEEYSNPPIIRNDSTLFNPSATLNASGSSRGRIINARLYRGVM
jgi:hypothetical protein